MGTGTTNYGLSRPTVGSDNNTWGTQINTALETVDTQLYNKTDKRDGKGVAISINFSGNTITDASSSSEFKNYISGDRLYITNASSNTANRGEFYVNSVTSDNALVVKKSDASTDANFIEEAGVVSVVSLIVREPFTRSVFSHLTGEIKLFASTTTATIQALGSISDAGATRYAWLACNGQAVSKTVYKDLYEVLKNGGSTGVFGESGSNFNVPDLRGRVPVGDDTMTGSDASRLPTAGDHIGEAGGSHEHTLTSAESGVKAHGHADNFTATHAHTHDLSDHTHNTHPSAEDVGSLTGLGNLNGGGLEPGVIDIDSTSVRKATEGPSTNTSGDASSETVTISGSVTNHAGESASSAHSILQPYQVIGSYIIAT